MLNFLKSFFAKQFSTLYYFYQFIGYRIFLLLFFNFLSVLADGLGLTMFIPLLEMADKGVSEGSSKLILAVKSFFDFCHIPLTVGYMLALIVVIFFLKALFVYFTLFYQSSVIQDFIKKIRARNSLGLSQLKYSEFVSTDVGRLQNTLTGEANLVVDACRTYLETIKNIMVVAVYLAFAFTVDWQFSFLVLIGGALTNFIYQGFYKKTVSLSRGSTSLNNEYSGLVIQSVSQFKYLKATGRNSYFLNRMSFVLNNIITNNIRSSKISSFLVAIREPIMVAVICIVIGVQVFVIQESLSSIMIILVLFYRAMAYIISVQSTWAQYLGRIGSMDNMRDFEQYLKLHKEDLSGVQSVSKKIDDIKVIDYSLSFDTVKVLDNVQLSIAPCSSIAFVGETGSGKSTLVNVIVGLLSSNTGKLLINGLDSKDVDLNWYRSRIGYVSQDSTIFDGDIFDNITFWAERTEANLDKFWSAVEMSSLKDFISGLTAKEKSVLGNNGLNLSGGQKQRISIARELYRDIDLLILDEATSALDAQTEKDIKDSLDKLNGKVTMVTIAHRLSTIKDVDTVYLLHKGKIVNSGSFEELKSKSDYFKKMTELQGV